MMQADAIRKTSSLYRIGAVVLMLAACLLSAAAVHVLNPAVSQFAVFVFEKSPQEKKIESDRLAAESAMRATAQELFDRLGSFDPFNPAGFAALAKLNTAVQDSGALATPEMRTQLANLLGFQNRLLAIADRTPQVHKELFDLAAAGRPLNPAALRPDSGLRPIAVSAQALLADFTLLKDKKPSTNLRAFQSKLRGWFDALAAASKPEELAKLSAPERLLFKRVQSLVLSQSAEDWESALFSALSVAEELKRLSGQAATPPTIAVNDAAQKPMVFDRPTASQAIGVLAAVCFLFAVYLGIRGERAMSKALAELDEQALSPRLSPAGKRVYEAVPYMQMASKQMAEISANVSSGIKRIGKSLAQLPLSSEVLAPADLAAAAPTGSLASDFSAQLRPLLVDLKGSFSTLRQQSIQLFLTLSSSSADPKVLESLDRVSESLEHVDSLADQIVQQVNQLEGVQQPISNEPDGQPAAQDQVDRLTEAREAMQREVEGILVLVSQWSRQSDRLGAEIVELADVIEKERSGGEALIANDREPRLS